jgi:pimeloyl-ACP methyl ester carboxylesterase
LQGGIGGLKSGPERMGMTQCEFFRMPMPGVPDGFLSLRHRAAIARDSDLAGPPRRPVLLVHGATFGSALFDVPLAGYSLMAALAAAGHAVYALDIRGYGRSFAPGVMDDMPERHPPFARANQVAGDVAAAVDFILAREDEAALNLIGFSWGSITASRFAGANASKVARLALYAPLYRETGALLLVKHDAAYRWVTQEAVISRWDHDLEPGTAAVREPGIAELLFETVAAQDPRARSHTPPAFRCPNGAMADLQCVAGGEAPFDPAKLTMPVLLVRGEHDVTSTDADARRLLAALPCTDKTYRTISPGSHFLCIERGRGILYDEIEGFLRERGS